MRNVCRLVVCGALAMVAACDVEDPSVADESTAAAGIQEVAEFASDESFQMVPVATRAIAQVPVGATGVTMTTTSIVIDGACGVGNKCITIQLTNNTANALRGTTVILDGVSPVTGNAIGDDNLPPYLWRGGYPEHIGVWVYGNLAPGASASRVWTFPNVPTHKGVHGKVLADVVAGAALAEASCTDRVNSDGDKYADCLDGDCATHAACLHFPPDCADWLSYGMKENGSYPIDPDGAGSVAKLTAYCDQQFQGGGWTLIMSSGPPSSAIQSPAVTQGSNRYLPSLTMRAIANTSTQVMIRTNGSAVEYAVSNAGTPPIVNFRNGNGAYITDTADEASHWTGPMKDAGRMWITCNPGFTIYPAIYHACNNEGGLHWTSTLSRWVYSTGVNQTLNMYFR